MGKRVIYMYNRFILCSKTYSIHFIGKEIELYKLIVVYLLVKVRSLSYSISNKINRDLFLINYKL